MKKARGLKIPTFRKLPALSFSTAFDSVHRLLYSTFMLGAVILAAWWLTHLTAPRPVARLPSAPMAMPDTSAMMVNRLFATSHVPTEALEGLRLTGIYSGTRGGGFATFDSKKGAISVFVGDEIVPGVKLKAVERERAIVLAAGGQKELPLPGSRGTPDVSAAQSSPEIARQAIQPVTNQLASQPRMSRVQQAPQQQEEE